ncbi:TetR/AcrR family transcriptional regulator [Roseicitreum antarcticum]|uniref:Transcriptional regulator, TetR family n=1 Tax=Roseicitreum antarcticum TaxID=564137 RepID=A0A1H2TPI7_9RHOB|nr:TetR/AcrR family transcriptional regulator [Roseicitreum antarcticum]SDW45702.1 transcriptional regulator, TetR family [Roseicitreum antarcticum]
MTVKRNRMSPEARKTAILDAATRLLTVQPWENVTVAGIVAAAGISKGGFYHHFISREDVLLAVIQRLADDSVAAGQASLARLETDPVARYSNFLIQEARWELSHAGKIAAIVRMAKQDGNAPLLIRLKEESLRRNLPIVRALIGDGMAKSVFQVVDVGLTADLLLEVGRMRWPTFLRARQLALAGDRASGWQMIRERVRAEEGLTNRLLGLADRAVRFAPVDDYAPLLDPGCALP